MCQEEGLGLGVPFAHSSKNQNQWFILLNACNLVSFQQLVVVAGDRFRVRPLGVHSASVHHICFYKSRYLVNFFILRLYWWKGYSVTQYISLYIKQFFIINWCSKSPNFTSGCALWHFISHTFSQRLKLYLLYTLVLNEHFL